MKKLHFKLFKYILTRPYPFDHWLVLLTSYSKLWIYSVFYSLIISLILQIPLINVLKFYFVITFSLMIIFVMCSYKLKDLFLLIYDTVNQLFRMIIGRIFGLKPIDYYCNYKSFDQRKYYGKNVLDFDNERSKIFEKKYDEIDFLVLNDYITIEEGNKRTDELLRQEYRCGFYRTLGSHYYTYSFD